MSRKILGVVVLTDPFEIIQGSCGLYPAYLCAVDNTTAVIQLVKPIKIGGRETRFFNAKNKIPGERITDAGSSMALVSDADQNFLGMFAYDDA